MHPNLGVVAVLSQEDSDGTNHPVGYFSRKFLPMEKAYSTVERECLTVKLGIEAFKVYTYLEDNLRFILTIMLSYG